MQEWLVFICGTLLLAYFSSASLRHPGSHGFYRFFAWEIMLVLVVLNLSTWYDAPLALDQIISGVLMSLSIFFVLMGYLSLNHYGQQDERRAEAHLLEFERTTKLVTQGIYRHIRHPMYTSLITLDGGLYFKQITWTSSSFALASLLFLIAAVYAEEKENIGYFGDAYREYMKRSKRFVPFLL